MRRFHQGINAMMSALLPSALVPSGFHVESAACDGATTVLTVHPISMTSRCADCGSVSGRVYSRYSRRLADSPLSGRSVLLIVVARRFRCGAASCQRSIFTERFRADVPTPWARRTARLDCLACRPWRSPGGEFRLPLDAASQQRHAFEGPPPARLSAGPASGYRGRRRLGIEAQSALQHDHLRSRAAAAHPPLARS